MPDRPNEAFAKRQAQWDAFHQWESSKKDGPLSLEERLAWYCAAFSLSRTWSSAADRSRHLDGRVKAIREMHNRLAHLHRTARDA